MSDPDYVTVNRRHLESVVVTLPVLLGVPEQHTQVRVPDLWSRKGGSPETELHGKEVELGVTVGKEVVGRVGGRT